VPPLRFRLRTLMYGIAVAAVLMLLVRVRAEMNAFFHPIPLFDVSVLAGAVLGVTVGFVLVWVRYWSLRTGPDLENVQTPKKEAAGGPKRQAQERVG
jgi:cation transporter-like permease